MAKRKKTDTPTQQGVLVQKPRTSIYSVLLIVASLALFIGCALLYLELYRYGGLRAVIGG